MLSMPRVNDILQHKGYEDYCRKNKLAEEQRIYCRHGSDHGVTVARIAYIHLLEEQMGAGLVEARPLKEIVYAAGILHDIGRWVEYQTQEDHALVGSRLAIPILRECGFTDAEIETITLGILEHRRTPEETSTSLGQALARADDWARDCRNCLSRGTCYKYTKAMEEIII